MQTVRACATASDSLFASTVRAAHAGPGTVGAEGALAGVAAARAVAEAGAGEGGTAGMRRPMLQRDFIF